jgi:two-component system chemotaxis sensor kinase CheA
LEKLNSSEDFLKIKVKFLEQFTSIINELTINNILIEHKLKEYNDNELFDLMSTGKRLLTELQQTSLNLRLVSINQIFLKLPQIVRTAAKKTGKRVKLITNGANTEIDKGLLNSLQDPILHIIRNSVDHGIEGVEERLQKNKPAEGKICIKAYREKTKIDIIIEDDGKGFDIEKIKQKLLKSELIEQEKLELLTEKEILDFVFHPGFSTNEQVTDLSGRGVGMDVVKNTINKLRGTVSIQTKKEHGSIITISLPITIAIFPALVCRISNNYFAVPLETINDTVSIDKDEIIMMDEKNQKIYYNEVLIPLIDVSKLLSFNYFTKPSPSRIDNKFISALIVKNKTENLALLVDEIVDQDNIVLKPVNKFIKLPNFIIGFTILGRGEPVLIINVANLL